MAEPHFDLKQVSSLFNNCITHIRNRQNNNLDAEAANWLNRARLHLMKQIESSFYNLAKAADNPLSLPLYALDPNVELMLSTLSWPPVLNPYKSQFKENIQSLMDECGFNARIDDFWTGPIITHPHLSVAIRFPNAILPGSKRQGRKLSPAAIKAFSATILRITATPGEDEIAQELKQEGPGSSTGIRETKKKGTKRGRKKVAGTSEGNTSQVVKQENGLTGTARKRRRSETLSEENKDIVLEDTFQQRSSGRVTRSRSKKMDRSTPI